MHVSLPYAVWPHHHDKQNQDRFLSPIEKVRIFLGIHLTSGKLMCVFRGCSNVERVPEAVISSGIHVVVSPCD
ncbi:hypothetical protein PVAP13_3KG450500 [Panicum virgatum]|uniref:Uncharacterized protein n=1 Tax=Panicum virgatum TaxID=38727 RepID=A0A8T0VAA3_PANVG|nr:hypothetical protein PVAP13_3KG450500 [Panicum virgatum]KAG2629793.1 hypothetical protein PVAP13_3KG450500 [Panicum virgatum]KAG2629794.1 hypothetical protein PVAP13_3KG450500 [Panicum virgatum]